VPFRGVPTPEERRQAAKVDARRAAKAASRAVIASSEDVPDLLSEEAKVAPAVIWRKVSKVCPLCRRRFSFNKWLWGPIKKKSDRYCIACVKKEAKRLRVERRLPDRADLIAFSEGFWRTNRDEWLTAFEFSESERYTVWKCVAAAFSQVSPYQPGKARSRKESAVLAETSKVLVGLFEGRCSRREAERLANETLASIGLEPPIKLDASLRETGDRVRQRVKRGRK
jgi:hypothetical protein